MGLPSIELGGWGGEILVWACAAGIPGRHSGEAEVGIWMYESAVVEVELSRR